MKQKPPHVSVPRGGVSGDGQVSGPTQHPHLSAPLKSKEDKRRGKGGGRGGNTRLEDGRVGSGMLQQDNL